MLRYLKVDNVFFFKFRNMESNYIYFLVKIFSLGLGIEDDMKSVIGKIYCILVIFALI